jgi:hypothetical protein
MQTHKVSIIGDEGANEDADMNQVQTMDGDHARDQNPNLPFGPQASDVLTTRPGREYCSSLWYGDGWLLSEFG